jgi:hypothetical protein
MAKINYKTTAVLVIDIGEPWQIHAYYDEEKANNYFIRFLSEKYNLLQQQGASIIEINYIGNTNSLLDVKFDYSTTDKNKFKKYLIKNNLSCLVYTGFHYPVCTNFGRELSSYNVTDWDFIERVDICPLLTRSYKNFYGDYIDEDLDRVGQIIL